MKRVISVSLLGAALLLTGCENMGTGQTVGTVGGAVAGGLIGSAFGGGTGKTVATIAGAAGGAYLGSSAGKSYDQSHGN